MKEPLGYPMKNKETKAETQLLASCKGYPGPSSFSLFSLTCPAAFLLNYLLSI